MRHCLPWPAALLALCAPAAAQTTIDFELGGPCAFAGQVALSNEYAGSGVLFSGPAVGDGGCVLDQCGNFGVNALSGTNFLAFNDFAASMTGTPTGPETMTFAVPASAVSIWVAGGDAAGSFQLDAYNGAVLVDSDAVVAQGWMQLTVAAASITHVVLDELGADPHWVADDLKFASGGGGAVELFAGNANASPINDGALTRLDPVTFAGALVGDTVTPGGLSGLTFTPDGRLWGSVRLGGGFGGPTDLVEINPLTGAAISTKPIVDPGGIDMRIADLATQPGTGVVYGCGNDVVNQVSGSIYRIDVNTGIASFVGDTGLGNDGGLAFAPDGTLYMCSAAVANPFLATLDPNTALVGALVGLGPEVGLDGLAARPGNGELLATRGQFAGGDLIVRIDPNTGNSVGVGSTGVGTPSDIAFSPGGSCAGVFCDANPANIADLDISNCVCAAGSAVLQLSNAPPNQFGYPLVGQGAGVITNPPGAFGDLCLGGATIGRYDKDALFTDAAGNASVDVLNAISGGGGGNIPTIGGNLCNPPNQTWNFQWWHRDGMNPSKFSKAIRVPFQ